MIHDEPDDVHWADDIKDFQPEYTPVKAWSILQLYTLKGRTSTLTKDNLIPIKYLYYCVYDPIVKRFYKRLARPYPIENLLYPDRPTLTFAGDDQAITNLTRYIDDRNLTILYSTPQINDVSDLLKRLWQANFHTEGKLDYKLYIQILSLSLKLEDFQNNQKGITGYRTVINQLETAITELWQKAIPKI